LKIFAPLGGAPLAAEMNIRKQLENGEKWAKNVNGAPVGSLGSAFHCKHFLR
jgi:hypothetical protein